MTGQAKERALHLTGPLLLLGAGKMGSALLDGWLGLGVDPHQVYVIDPHPTPDAEASLKAAGVRLNPHSVPTPSIVLLAVKPQVVDSVLPTLAPHIGPDTLVISIIAGKTLAGLSAGLPERTALVRSMPNTPAAVGRGVTVLVANKYVSPRQRDETDALLSAVGDVAWIEDEGLMDAVTAVSGSGPAYVFLLTEALAHAGLKAGLSADLSNKLARATVAGAGEMLHQTDLPAAVLRKNVTSPGGTTAAALEVLMAEEDGLDPLLSRAVDAAAQRSRDLG